jgi:hypothetical protein
MFEQLQPIVALLRSALELYNASKKAKARREDILELLCTYFLLVDVIKDGRSLLDSIGTDPAARLAGLDPSEAQRTTREWARVTKRQAARLDLLGVRLLGQDALAVFDPSLKDHLVNMIGSKSERADSLHGIGAGLIYYLMLV